MKIFFLFTFLLIIQITNAQVGIGNTNPKARLDITASNALSPSNTDGVLIPRANKFPNTNPTIDQNGMLLFITGNGITKKGFYFWNQSTTSWKPISKWIENEANNTIYNDFSDHIAIGVANTSARFEVRGDGIDNIGGAVKIINTNAKRNLIVTSMGDENQNFNFSRALEINNNVNSLGNFTKNTGVLIEMNGASVLNSSIYGTYTRYAINSNYAGNIYGNYTTSFNKTAQEIYGFYSTLQTSGTGDRYGFYSNIGNANFGDPIGTGNLYGLYSKITTEASGSRTSYGVYSESQLATGYAGYFIGRMSLGNSFSNRYLMPDADGSANQVLTTDGSGNTSWSNDFTTANNGLTETSANIQLGGALTQNTTITQGNFDTTFTVDGTGDFTVYQSGLGAGNLINAKNSGSITIGHLFELNEPRLQVLGVTNFGGFVASFYNGSNNQNSGCVAIKLRNATPNNLSRYIGFFRDNGNTQSGAITANFASGGVNYTTVSDRRLKTNIQDINNSLEILQKIQPRIYEYKANRGKKEYGFIAQELQKQYPQAVSGTPDSDVIKNPMMVDYSRLTPLLAAGIKELHNKIKNQKAQIKSIKTEARKLEQKYKNLEARLNALEVR